MDWWIEWRTGPTLLFTGTWPRGSFQAIGQKNSRLEETSASLEWSCAYPTYGLATPIARRLPIWRAVDYASLIHPTIAPSISSHVGFHAALNARNPIRHTLMYERLSPDPLLRHLVLVGADADAMIADDMQCNRTGLTAVGAALRRTHCTLRYSIRVCCRDRKRLRLHPELEVDPQQ